LQKVSSFSKKELKKHNHSAKMIAKSTITEKGRKDWR